VKSPVIHHFSTRTDLGGISIYLPRSRNLYSADRLNYSGTDFVRDFPGAWVNVLPEILE